MIQLEVNLDLRRGRYERSGHRHARRATCLGLHFD